MLGNAPVVPTLLAPAKINVTLEVLARRSDGFHGIRSLMVPVAWYDRIEIAFAATPSFVASDPELASNNLVERALAAVGARPAAVTLDKAIPVGGGLGGGSSDAAAIVRAALSGTLPLDVADEARDWPALARALGSDVPFFLAGTAAIVEGTGERVTPVGALPSWWTVVVRPPVAVATAEAYRRLDASRGEARESRSRSSSATLAAVDALQRGDFAALQATMQNDFQAVVADAYPAVARALAALEEAGAARALLSGSGSCVFALFENEAAARDCAARVDAAAGTAVASALHHDGAWR